MLYSQVKEHKSKHLDDMMDTIRQMILIKWNQRKRVAQKFEGKILPHIVQKLRDDSYNLDIEVIKTHLMALLKFVLRSVRPLHSGL